MTDEEKLEEIWQKLVQICKEFPVEIIIIPEQKRTCSSIGSEQLPLKEKAGGSSPLRFTD